MNAANARWGNLYDALYGTNVIPGDKGKGYNEERGKKVIAYVRKFLDETFSLENGSWNEVSEIKIKEKDLVFLVNKKEINLKKRINSLATMEKKKN